MRAQGGQKLSRGKAGWIFSPVIGWHETYLPLIGLEDPPLPY